MIKTTVIGSFPKLNNLTVPTWFDNNNLYSYNPKKYTKYLQTFDVDNTIELLKRIKEIIIRQDNIGINILTDGEIKRENYIFYLLRHITGIDFKKIKHKKIMENTSYIYSPTITSQLKLNRNILANDFEIAKLFTPNNIKMTIPGPFTILDTINNEYYDSEEDLLHDLSKIINYEIIDLVKKGCKYIQLDEPSLIYEYNNLSDRIKYINNCFANIPDNITKIIHISSGYPNKLNIKLNKNVDAYKVLLPILDNSIIDQISIECIDHEDNFKILELVTKKYIIYGVIDIGSTDIETIHNIKIKIFKALKYIDSSKLIISPNGGLGMLSEDICYKKLENMVYAVKHVNVMLDLI